MEKRIITAKELAGELQITTSRSSGPGGQNVNKVNTKVTLRWNVPQSELVTSTEKELLIQKLSAKLTGDGDLIVSAQDKRSQLDNKEEAFRKLDALLARAFVKNKVRKATKPSQASKADRLTRKKRQSEKKKMRQEKF